MGGTFDPIHHGHLVAASEVQALFGLDEVVFVPTGQPWQKAGRDVSPAEDRYLMTVIATASNPKFTVTDDAEIKLKEAEFDILILLKELLNPDDPHSSVKQELGFRSERFAPLQTDSEETEEYELVGTGKAKEWEPQPM